MFKFILGFCVLLGSSSLSADNEITAKNCNGKECVQFCHWSWGSAYESPRVCYEAGLYLNSINDKNAQNFFHLGCVRRPSLKYVTVSENETKIEPEIVEDPLQEKEYIVSNCSAYLQMTNSFKDIDFSFLVHYCFPKEAVLSDATSRYCSLVADVAYRTYILGSMSELSQFPKKAVVKDCATKNKYDAICNNSLLKSFVDKNLFTVRIQPEVAVENIYQKPERTALTLSIQEVIADLYTRENNTTQLVQLTKSVKAISDKFVSICTDYQNLMNSADACECSPAPYYGGYTE